MEAMKIDGKWYYKKGTYANFYLAKRQANYSRKTYGIKYCIMPTPDKRRYELWISRRISY